jgi:hypothetical protein
VCGNAEWRGTIKLTAGNARAKPRRAPDGGQMLGFTLLARKRYDEAEPWLKSGFEGLILRKDTIDWPSRSVLPNACEWLVRLYSEWGNLEKAAEYRKALQVAGR